MPEIALRSLENRDVSASGFSVYEMAIAPGPERKKTRKAWDRLPGRIKKFKNVPDF
jgi:hypothetical protein